MKRIIKPIGPFESSYEDLYLYSRGEKIFEYLAGSKAYDYLTVAQFLRLTQLRGLTNQSFQKTHYEQIFKLVVRRSDTS